MCSNGHWTFVMPGQRLSQHRSGAALCVTAKSDVRCPLWVKSGHFAEFSRCPLYPQKRTSLECSGDLVFGGCAASGVSRARSER